jgi:hypothetical protein
VANLDVDGAGKVLMTGFVIICGWKRSGGKELQDFAWELDM